MVYMVYMVYSMGREGGKHVHMFKNRDIHKEGLREVGRKSGGGRERCGVGDREGGDRRGEIEGETEGDVI